MEFAMREWLTVIIVLLILGVLLDGWRRMRQSRGQSIKMSRTMYKGVDKDDLDAFGSELPNGGARVVDVRDETDTRQLTQKFQQKFEKSKTTSSSRMSRIPEQVALNLEEEVPVLMDSVAHGTDQRVEPTMSGEDEDIDLLDADDSQQSEDELDPLFMDAEPLPPAARTIPATPAEPRAAETSASRDNSSKLSSSATGRSRSSTSASSQSKPAFTTLKDNDKGKTADNSAPVAEAQPDEVLVINVMAGNRGHFPGADLLEVILECGMRYGDMQIFHRYQKPTGEGSLFFSMANMVVPGTFDLNGMADFSTPGVSLFMTLPMSANSVEAFNTMAMTAAAIAERLGGELKDETRSAMTNQTLEHCRQRIIEYERKRQLMSS